MIFFISIKRNWSLFFSVEVDSCGDSFDLHEHLHDIPHGTPGVDTGDSIPVCGCQHQAVLLINVKGAAHCPHVHCSLPQVECCGNRPNLSICCDRVHARTFLLLDRHRGAGQESQLAQGVGNAKTLKILVKICALQQPPCSKVFLIFWITWKPDKAFVFEVYK